MVDTVRILAIGGSVLAVGFAVIAAPSVLAAVAETPVAAAAASVETLFPPPFDASKLTKFDITFADSISSDIKRTDTIKKIGFGKKTIVSIVTTPSGTYSSDALTSPYVRYPGIDVAPKAVAETSPEFGTLTSPNGTWFWSSFTVGSITYYSSSFKPAR